MTEPGDRAAVDRAGAGRADDDQPARRSPGSTRRTRRCRSSTSRSSPTSERHPGCRNVDIAAHFQLNKSTVSRQVANLVDLGLVEIRDSGSDVRGQGLTLTDAGDRLRRRLADEVLAALNERLASWSEHDLQTFADLMERFNAGDWPEP